MKIVLLIFCLLAPIHTQAEISACECVRMIERWETEEFLDYEKAIELYKDLSENDWCLSVQIVFIPSETKITNNVGYGVSGKWLVVYKYKDCVECKPFE